MGEDTRKRQAEDARATEENSGKAPTTRLQKKDVVPALSGSLLPPLLRQEQPGMPAHAFATWKISPFVLLTCGSDLSCSFCCWGERGHKFVDCFFCVNVAGVMGEDTRKRQAENTIATEENSWKAPTTGLHQKDVVPALSGSPLPPLLRGQQPGMPAHAFATWKISPSVLLTWGSDLSCSFCWWGEREVTNLLIVSCVNVSRTVSIVWVWCTACSGSRFSIAKYCPEGT
jgi:hypothetical protein